MNSKKKNQKILSKEIQMYFSKEFQYKGQMFAWIIADIIKIVGLCFIWLATSKVSNNVEQSYIITYYILLMFVGKFTADYTLEYGIRDIIEGRFSNFLVKPFNHLLEYLGTNIGGNILRVFLFLPAFIVAICLAQNLGFWIVEFNPYRIVLACLAIVIGFGISFLLGNIVSLIAMKVKEMDGVRILYYNVASMLSGEFIPIIFLPTLGKFFLETLPFRYTLSFPVEILIGKINDYQVERGFISAILWLILLYVSYRIIFNHAIRKYEAEGI